MYEELPEVLRVWAREHEAIFMVEASELTEDQSELLRDREHEVWTMVHAPYVAWVEIRPGFHQLPHCQELPNPSSWDDKDEYAQEFLGKETFDLEMAVCYFVTRKKWQEGTDPFTPDPDEFPWCYCVRNIMETGRCRSCHGTGILDWGHPCEACSGSGHGWHRECGYCNGWGASIWSFYDNDLVPVSDDFTQYLRSAGRPKSSN